MKLSNAFALACSILVAATLTLGCSDSKGGWPTQSKPPTGGGETPVGKGGGEAPGGGGTVPGGNATNATGSLTAHPWCTMIDGDGAQYLMRLVFSPGGKFELNYFLLNQDGSRGQSAEPSSGNWTLTGDMLKLSGEATNGEVQIAITQQDPDTGAARLRATNKQNGEMTAFDPCN